MARVALLSDAKITPGDDALAQAVLSEPVVALIGQRFVIRSHAPLRTIGGGEVLFPYDKKPKGRKARNELAGFLNKLASTSSLTSKITAIIERYGLLQFGGSHADSANSQTTGKHVEVNCKRFKRDVR